MAEGAKASSPGGEAGTSAEPAAAPAPGSARPPPSSAAVDPLIGRVISGRFKLTSLIARGGMGRVYRAEQAPLGRICAVKVLTTTYEGEHDPEFHKRFFLEASIASKITHPNSVTIFDYGQTEDDVYYMAMEYLEGVTLHRAIRLARHLPEGRVAHIGRQVCRALREAHALGCIHRDLKPANIFLTEHGDEPDFVKVLDFGLVKNVLGDGKPEDQLTQTGLFMGSPKYMAPEQIRGERVDARTDVYSLGIIMYEMLTGKVPFERGTSLNTLMAQVNDAPPRLRETNPEVQVSPELEDLVYRCIAKDPAHRAASMDEVLATLKQIGGPGGVGLTGEYRALGASSSGPYARLDQPAPSRPPPSVAYPGGGRSLNDTGPQDSQSVSVSISSTGGLNPPSLTPLLESAGGGSVSVRPPSLPPPNFRGSGRRNAGLVVGGLAVAGVAAVLMLRSPVQPVASADPALHPSSLAAVPPPPPVASAAEAPARAPAPAPVATTLAVRFLTDPPGASVKENGQELCPATPCEHGFVADMSLEHKVTITRSGYRPEARVVRASDSQVALTLVPVPSQRASGAASRSTSPKPAEAPGSTPQGFKDIPY